MGERDKEEVVNFVYTYGTLDSELIEKEVPEVKGLTSKEIANIIDEDYEKIEREIEYTVHPDYEGTCAV